MTFKIRKWPLYIMKTELVRENQKFIERLSLERRAVPNIYCTGTFILPICLYSLPRDKFSFISYVSKSRYIASGAHNKKFEPVFLCRLLDFHDQCLSDGLLLLQCVVQSFPTFQRNVLPLNTFLRPSDISST
jgi:hypothetical protein